MSEVRRTREDLSKRRREIYDILMDKLGNHGNGSGYGSALVGVATDIEILIGEVERLRDENEALAKEMLVAQNEIRSLKDEIRWSKTCRVRISKRGIRTEAEG